MEAGNGKQVSNSCVVEKFSEVNTQRIAFPQQERSIETRKIGREPSVYESPYFSATGMEERIPVLLRFFQGYQIHITAHITPEPDFLIGKMLSVIECSWVVKVPCRSESNSASQPLSHRPLFLTISNGKEQVAWYSLPAFTFFVWCQVQYKLAAGWALFDGIYNGAREDYTLCVQELLNGAGRPIGIRNSARGYYANKDEDNHGQEPWFPGSHEKEQKEGTEEGCQDKEGSNKLRREVVAYNNATTEAK
jgi:hypothetical protein